MYKKEEKIIIIEYPVKYPNNKIFYCNDRKITYEQYKRLKRANKKGIIWALNGYHNVIDNGIVKHIINLHQYNIKTQNFI